jgi:hypothetical protein
MTTRVYRPGWLKVLRKIASPKRTIKRWAKRKTKKITKRKVVRMKRPAGTVRRDGWDSIRPGRSIVEWIPHPECGRGRVLAFLPGRTLEVEFEDGTRPPYGIEIEDVRLLA